MEWRLMSDWQKPWRVWIGARSKALRDWVSRSVRRVCWPGCEVSHCEMMLASGWLPISRPSEIACAAERARRSEARSRSRNSAVAACVNVLTRIWSTRSPRSMSNRNQSKVMEKVLPVPALASMEVAPDSSWTRGSN